MCDTLCSERTAFSTGIKDFNGILSTGIHVDSLENRKPLPAALWHTGQMFGIGDHVGEKIKET